MPSRRQSRKRPAPLSLWARIKRHCRRIRRWLSGAPKVVWLWVLVLVSLSLMLGMVHGEDDGLPPDGRVRMMLAGDLTEARTVTVYRDDRSVTPMLALSFRAHGETMDAVYLIRPPRLTLVLAEGENVAGEGGRPCPLVWWHLRYITPDGVVRAMENVDGQWEQSVAQWCRSAPA